MLPDRVRLLAQIAERAEEIDVDARRRARAAAEELLQAAQAGNADIDMERARVSLMKAHDPHPGGEPVQRHAASQAKRRN